MKAPFINSLLIPCSLCLAFFVSCGMPGTKYSAIEGHTLGAKNDSFPSAGNFRLSLVDRPPDEINEVIVNIDHVEMKLESADKKAWVKFAQDLGQVDLLKLQNGISLPLIDLDIPEGVAVSQLRLVLKNDGNYITRTGGTVCNLDTPSAQQSGLKLKFSTLTNIESGFTYSMILDFDALKSIVIQGNGGCLLKPVLLIKNFERATIDDANNSGSIPEPPGVDIPTTPIDPLPVETTVDQPVSSDPGTTTPSTPIDEVIYIDDFATGGLDNYFAP